MQRQREEYWEKVRDIPAKKLIFIDETGTDLAMIRLDARARKGERARGKRPKTRRKRVSTIGALGYKGMIASCNISGTLNQITFEAFIAIKLVPKLKKGDYVILDIAFLK
ncbi:MAG: transposase [Spirulina sp.]